MAEMAGLSYNTTCSLSCRNDRRRDTFSSMHRQQQHQQQQRWLLIGEAATYYTLHNIHILGYLSPLSSLFRLARLWFCYDGPTHTNDDLFLARRGAVQRLGGWSAEPGILCVTTKTEGEKN